jgi:hypothetical protein
MSAHKDRQTGELRPLTATVIVRPGSPNTQDLIAIVLVRPGSPNTQDLIWSRIGVGVPFWLARSESEMSGHRYAIRYPSTSSAAKAARMMGGEVRPVVVR